MVAVSVPAELAQGQRGRGNILKFRFSPYTLIEFLRIAILKVSKNVLQLTMSSFMNVCRTSFFVVSFCVI